MDMRPTMASIPVCYGTGEGQTAKVADHLGGELTVRGHDPTTVTVNAAEATAYVDVFVEELTSDVRDAG